MGVGAASGSRANVLLKKYKTSSLDTSENQMVDWPKS
jgi:hypothetical protein